MEGQLVEYFIVSAVIGFLSGFAAAEVHRLMMIAWGMRKARSLYVKDDGYQAPESVLDGLVSPSAKARAKFKPIHIDDERAALIEDRALKANQKKDPIFPI